MTNGTQAAHLHNTNNTRYVIHFSNLILTACSLRVLLQITLVLALYSDLLLVFYRYPAFITSLYYGFILWGISPLSISNYFVIYSPDLPSQGSIRHVKQLILDKWLKSGLV